MELSHTCNYITFGITLHLELRQTWNYVTHGITSHLELRHTWNYITLEITSHLELHYTRNYVTLGITFSGLEMSTELVDLLSTSVLEESKVIMDVRKNNS